MHCMSLFAKQYWASLQLEELHEAEAQAEEGRRRLAEEQMMHEEARAAAARVRTLTPLAWPVLAQLQMSTVLLKSTAAAAAAACNKAYI